MYNEDNPKKVKTLLNILTEPSPHEILKNHEINDVATSKRFIVRKKGFMLVKGDLETKTAIENSSKCDVSSPN